MNFAALVQMVKDRLNLTSTEATTRVGAEINSRYKEVSSAIGMAPSRRTTVQISTTLGVQDVIFTGIEKVLSVYNPSSGRNVVLDEITPDEMRAITPAETDHITRYCIYRMAATTVTIRLDVLPQSAITLYADGFETADVLSGTQEPKFAESFHDILVEGVVADELKKMEKRPLANDAEEKFQRRLSDLRMFIAKSGYLTIQQSKNQSNPLPLGSGGGSSTANGASSYTQTGLITFDRDPSAPFAVTASSAKVDNLDADKLDGIDGTSYLARANHTGVQAETTISPITTDRLLGRDTAGSGAVEQLSVSGGIEFTGSAGIRTAAFTGDVTKAAGGTALTIAANAVTTAKISDDQVTYPKMQNVSAASKIIGRGSAAGSGDPEEVSIGSGLTMSATTLKAAAGSVIQVVEGSVTVQATSTSSTLADTGLTASITPSSASNKILVLVSQAGISKSTNDTGVTVKLLRGASIISTLAVRAAKDGTSNTSYVGTVAGFILDSPASTSSVTYKTQFASSGNSANVFVQVDSERSSITLLEIVG